MKKCLIFALLLVVLMATSGCASANTTCPQADASRKIFKTSVYAGAVVAFEKSPDPDNPLDLVLYKGTDSCTRNVVDKYSVEGSEPVIESVFSYVLKGQPSLFLIVSWNINSRGVGTYGKLYQIYAYEKDGNGGLASSQLISERDEMTGMEGTADNEPSHFDGKTATEAKALVNRLGLQ